MRLFYGLSLPEELRLKTAALARGAAQRIPGRYALPENHHLTLAFIGEVTPERVSEAKAILARCAADFPAPRVRITGFGRFGKAENGILILHAQSDPPLEPLSRALKSALHAAALPADPGPFSPHVTLARHARAEDSALLPLAEPLSFTARQAHLYLSARDAQGTLRYTPLFCAEFADSGS